MMRAIRQHRWGGPEVLVLEELEDLEPATGEVRVDVRAAGVHLLDTAIREGRAGGPFPLPDLPMTPGREVAGVVDAVGPDVDRSWLGRSVVAHLGQASGGYATQALAPVSSLIALPDGVEHADAVAMVGTGRTALGILEEADIVPGDVVLVTAAAGGLGTLLVQAAVAAGTRVVAVGGGDEKLALASRLGAHVTVDYRRDGWGERVREALSGAGGAPGVTLALDGVGGEIGRSAFELVAPGGRMVLYGYTSGSPMSLTAGDLFERGVAVTAAIGPRMFARPGGIQALATEAIARLARGEWRAVVHPPFALADAPAAHRALHDRATAGKVVLTT